MRRQGRRREALEEQRRDRDVVHEGGEAVAGVRVEELQARQDHAEQNDAEVAARPGLARPTGGLDRAGAVSHSVAMARIRYDYLARHPGFVQRLAAWHYAEWAHLYATWTPALVAAELAAHRACAAIPTTLVAHADDAPVGSVSLLPEDGLPGFERYSPWLASLYVDVPWRGRGIGARLVRRAMALARALGVPRLHLFTPGQEAFYAALGWRAFAPATAEARAVTVMVWDARGRFSRS